MAKGDARKFFGAFLRNPTSVGAIAPSSPSLARAMVHSLRIAPGETILEFGPGTGAFTAAIRDTVDDPRSYLGIEIEPKFVKLLEERFPDLAFATGSASDAQQIVEERQLGPVRAILSGLPFASLPITVQNGIVEALQTTLGPGAMFRTFQYAHAFVLPNAVRFRRRMGEIFGTHERSRLVLRNLPPAYTLTWIR